MKGLFYNNIVSYLKFLVHKITVGINPTIEINRYYNKAFGHNANLKDPKSLIEKIYWMQMHCDTSLWTICADKYRMRGYVSKLGLGEYLPKLYGHWTSPDEIDFSSLPNQFVLKSNNGCGEVLIVKDKKAIDWERAKEIMRGWLFLPFGYSGYEPHYTRIQPCLIAEELLSQNEELNLISPESMVDYKFWCFNGHVESCFVAYGRNNKNLYIDLYDANWRRLEKHLRCFGKDRINNDVIIPKPKCLSQMKEIASKLSEGFPEMRVDLYLVSHKPVIGELTMSTGYGYFTEDYYNYLGDLTDLSLMKKIR